MRVAESETYVEVAQVSKVYRSGGADAVEAVSSVSFGVPRGQFVAILGPSGVGKSTLADLIVRYLDPDQGRILIDGQDIRQIALADLRREIMLLDQAPYLFNATIAENIAFAYPEAGSTEIEAAGSGQRTIADETGAQHGARRAQAGAQTGPARCR